MNEGFEFALHALKITGARFRFALGLLDRARERTPEKVGVAWGPVVARRTATSREGEAGRRRRRGERGTRVQGKKKQKQVHGKGMGSRGQGGKRK